MTADDAARPRIVVRDNRRVDANGSAQRSAPDSAAKPAESGPEPAKDDAPTVGETEAVEDVKASTESTADATEDTAEATGNAVGATETVEASQSPEKDAEAAKAMQAATKVETKESPEVKDESDAEGGHVFAELSALRSNLDELTRDLQRVTAEYANYRKRVDRDRTQVQEQATGAVLAALLPVLDDLDRARSHGDLVGPFAAVADQLTGALAKFGLTAFGESGDAFDPQLHEAVSHTSSPDVTETTCVEVMRRGYLLGDRLLRPALVGVADPE